MKRNIFQKQYDFELEQRNIIASNTNLPIVALTILGSALSTIIIGYKYTNVASTYLFILFISLTLLAMLFSLYCIIRSLLGYWYQKIPPAKRVVDHLESLEEWYLEEGRNTEEAKCEAIKDFDIYFDERLSVAADHNSVNNIKRGGYLHNATAAVTVAFVLLTFSAPFYIYQKAVKPDEVYKISILEGQTTAKIGEIMSSSENSGNTSSPQQSLPAASPATTPAATPAATPTQSTAPKTGNPKPTGPGNTMFKGSVETLKIKAEE